MNKIILSSIVIMIASLVVACSSEYDIKERDIIKADDVIQYQPIAESNASNTTSKTVKFPIYMLDNNVKVVKYLPIEDNISTEEKVNMIAKTMSAICFNDLPIEVKIDGKQANVNLIESDESRKTWEDDFLNEYNLENTVMIIVKNLLQEDYEGEWINTIQLSYEGTDIN